MTPALLTSMASGSSQVAANAARDAGFVTSSSATEIASRPVVAAISAAALAPAPVLRTASVTRAPAPASVRAVSMPMPDEAPVTIARLPVRSMPATTSAAVERNPNWVVMGVTTGRPTRTRSSRRAHSRGDSTARCRCGRSCIDPPRRCPRRWPGRARSSGSGCAGCLRRSCGGPCPQFARELGPFAWASSAEGGGDPEAVLARVLQTGDSAADLHDRLLGPTPQVDRREADVADQPCDRLLGGGVLAGQEDGGAPGGGLGQGVGGQRVECPDQPRAGHALLVGLGDGLRKLLHAALRLAGDELVSGIDHDLARE